MNEQTKLLLIGAGTAAIAKYVFQKDWMTAMIFSAVAVSAIIVDDVISSATA